MLSQAIRTAAPATISEPRELAPVQQRSPAITLSATVAVAFALRLFWIVKLHTYRIPAFPDDHFYFGYETGRIARSIALGQGFSNPFHGITGPTAWLAPVYPYLTAAVFKIFGIYTSNSAFVLLALNGLFSALTCIPLYFIARRVFGSRVALWSIWVWTLVAPLSFWAIHWVWETSLSTLLLTSVIWLSLEFAESPRWRLWVPFGMLWGLIALTNPSALSVLPFIAGWVCWRQRQQSKPWLLPAVASAVVFFAVVSPWIVRNYQVFHRFIFIRDNFGAELRLGNGPGAVGLWMEWLHPTQNTLEMDKYRRVGELAYVAERGHEASSYILHDPVHFLALCARRAIYFWAGLPRPVNRNDWVSHIETRNSGYLAFSILAFWGLWVALRRKKRGAFVFAVLLTMYPVVYYVVFPHPRYRHPIEPEMLILAVYLVSQTRNFRRRTPVVPLVTRYRKLSVVVPAGGSNGLPERIAQDVTHAPLALQKEVVVVSNGDDTRQLLPSFTADLADDTPALRLIHSPSHVPDQLRRALEHISGDLVLIQMGQVDPRDYTQLLEPIISGRADVVYGTASMRCAANFWRPARVLSAAFSMITNTDLSNVSAECRVFRRSDLERIMPDVDKVYFDSRLALAAYLRGCRFCEVALPPSTDAQRLHPPNGDLNWLRAGYEVGSILARRFLL